MLLQGWKYVGFAAVLLAFVQMQAAVWPFRHRLENVMESVSLMVRCATAMLLVVIGCC